MFFCFAFLIAAYDVREEIFIFQGQAPDDNDVPRDAFIFTGFNFSESVLYTQEELGQLTISRLINESDPTLELTPLKEAVWEAVLRFSASARPDAQRIMVIYSDGVGNVPCNDRNCPNVLFEPISNEGLESLCDDLLAVDRDAAPEACEDNFTPCGINPFLRDLDIRVLFFDTDDSGFDPNNIGMKK